MALDSDVADVALLGTGVAPLAVASEFISRGKSVLLLNPDFDFFRENSELPFDPSLSAGRIRLSQPDHALEELRPSFPGAIELATPGEKATGFHDPLAPHVRSRHWMFLRPENISPVDQSGLANTTWSAVEELFVAGHDFGLNPEEVEGLAALARFPGFTHRAQASLAEAKGIAFPRIADVDVVRYRNGLLEFVRERLGTDRVVTSADQIELTPDGVRFHRFDGLKTAKLRQGMLVFWTPRLHRWIQNHLITRFKKNELDLGALPSAIRVYEQWSIVSRERLDSFSVGVFENMIVWADVEGPFAPSFKLNILRLDSQVGVSESPDFASTSSFDSVFRLCHDLLGWDKFSLSSLSPRLILQWPTKKSAPSMISFPHGDLNSQMVTHSDGPLVQVVRQARAAAGKYL